MTERALVLGGGGITGIAWEVGLIAGLAEHGVDLRAADRVIGTSAGSIVGSQLLGGATVQSLFEDEVAAQPTPRRTDKPAAIDRWVMARYGLALVRSRGDLEDFGRRLGALSLQAGAAGTLPSLSSHLRAIGSRLAHEHWPVGDLRVTAVDTRTGALRVFTAADGVPLLRAVAASCAVPGVYPAVPIDGRLYVDGGARSLANADVARGCGAVLAITPMAKAGPGLPSTAGQLRALGVPSLIVKPDAAAIAAIGKNVLDPAARAASARAGRDQAAAVAESVRALWG